MIHPTFMLAVFALGGFFSCLAFAQEPPCSPSNDTASLEKQIAHLESKIAPLQKELQKLRRQVHEQSPVIVIPMKFANAVQTAEVVEKVYDDVLGNHDRREQL
jgi:septal ring factor EnvC (AmiA/AmiB activator)